MRTELKVEVLRFLSRKGISAREMESFVAVNRDSMCKVIGGLDKGDGIPEESIYPAVLLAIKEGVKTESGCRFFWAGKTDDDCLLDVMGN